MSDQFSQTTQRIFDYVAKSSHADISKVKESTLLFREGVFDSMAFVLLIDFLEENFKIKIQDSDLIEENFESIAAITAFIERKANGVEV